MKILCETRGVAGLKLAFHDDAKYDLDHYLRGRYTQEGKRGVLCIYFRAVRDPGSPAALAHLRGRPFLVAQV